MRTTSSAASPSSSGRSTAAVAHARSRELRPDARQHGVAAARPAPLARLAASAVAGASLPSIEARQRRGRRRLCSAASSSSSSQPLPSNNNNNNSPSSTSASSAILSFIGRYYLPLALVAAVCLGLAFPAPGAAAADAGAAAVSASGIFLLQGLTLRRSEVAAALAARGALAWGALSILIVTPVAGAFVALPLAAKAAAALGWTGAGVGAAGVGAGAAAAAAKTAAATAAAACSSSSDALASALQGLAAFACVPTALSSGATFTAQVGGNVALAVLLTVGSNLLGVVTVPLLLPGALEMLAGGGGSAAAATTAPSIDALPLLALLARVVLLPVAVGAALRAYVPGVAAAADARRREMRYASALLLALVPWSQVSKGAAQAAAAAAGGAAAGSAASSAAASSASSVLGAGPALVMAFFLGLGLHVLYLLINVAACRALRLGGELPDAAATGATGASTSEQQRRLALGVRRAVVLTCSVKTLPVAVAVLAQVAASGGPVLGPEAVVACVVAHLTQIVVDSALAARWADDGGGDG